MKLNCIVQHTPEEVNKLDEMTGRNLKIKKKNPRKKRLWHIAPAVQQAARAHREANVQRWDEEPCSKAERFTFNSRPKRKKNTQNKTAV